MFAHVSNVFDARKVPPIIATIFPAGKPCAPHNLLHTPLRASPEDLTYFRNRVLSDERPCARRGYAVERARFGTCEIQVFGDEADCPALAGVI
jgi:hypothetical protein